MRRVLVLSIAAGLIMLIGCSKKPEEKLVGTWEADFSALEFTGDEAKEMSDEDKKAFKEMFKEAKMTLEITADKKYTMKNQMPGEEEKKDEGEWEVTSSEENKITVKFKPKDEKEAKEGDKKKDTITLEFEGDDKFVTNMEGMKITFKKK